MKWYSVLIGSLIIASVVTISANVLKVGPGQPYATIQSAINAAVTGDTVKVLPGTYDEVISITKDIVVEGSGYENTWIQGYNNPMISMNSGKLMWFGISSSTGDGVHISGGMISNVVVVGSAGIGIYFPKNSIGILKNSTIVRNGSFGVKGEGTGAVVNCIVWENSGSIYSDISNVNSITYSDFQYGYAKMENNNLNQYPSFIGEFDFHISPSSPCVDTGNPLEVDPDGSRSDMGYFGGKDTPVYPVVISVNVKPLENGQVQIQAKARANY